MNRTNRPTCELSRRQMLRLAAAGVVGFSTSGWIEALAADAGSDPRRRKSCILLWMTGGPSQTDTFDPKPGHANGGEFKAIETAVPGILISEHLPKLAKQMKDIAIIRSMSTKEGDHGRATFNLRTGYQQTGPIRYPTLGSLVAKELGRDEAELPNFVSIAPVRAFNPGAFGPGFLGPQYAPLVVGERAVLDPQGGTDARNLSFKVDDLNLPPGVDNHAGRRPARAARFVPQGLPVQPSRGRPGEPPGCLPAGRPADAVGGGEGVRAGGGARRGPRCLRPDRVRPGLPAGPPARRAGRAVRRGLALRRRRGDGGRLGHAPAELRGGQEAQRGARPGLGGPDGRPAQAAGCSTRR